MRPDSIREKSSSEFDEPQQPQAVAVRGGQALAAGRAERVVGQLLLERAEHQRQRRAELVRDVGEERGLGAVDVGERLGPRALLLIGERVRQRAGDALRDEVEEAAVGLVELEAGADAGDQHARGTLAAGQAEREEQRLLERLLVRAGVNRAEARAEVGDVAAGRRRAARRRRSNGGRRGRPSPDAADAPRRARCGPRGAPSVRPRRRGRAARNGRSSGKSASTSSESSIASRTMRVRPAQLAEVAQRARAAVREHPRRRLGHWEKEAHDLPGVVADRAQREREPGLFEVALAVQEHRLVLEERGPARARGLERAADRRPRRRPALAIVGGELARCLSPHTFE